MSNVSKINVTDLADSEISLVEIIKFLQESWKTIAGFTALGIAAATLYLWVVPKEYEASAQIKLVQIVNVNNTRTNIEEPQALIARMAIPTSYSKETIAHCGLADQKDAAGVLASKVRFSIPKGVVGVLDLKIRDTSKVTAAACANSIYQLIAASQTQLIASYINETSKKLKIEKERLNRVTQVIANADKSGATVSAVYLTTSDEIRYLLDQITNLQNIIISNESLVTHLTAPIYVNDRPVLPQQRKSLLVGLLLGGFLGLVLALARKWYRSNSALF